MILVIFSAEITHPVKEVKSVIKAAKKTTKKKKDAAGAEAV